MNMNNANLISDLLPKNFVLLTKVVSELLEMAEGFNLEKSAIDKGTLAGISERNNISIIEVSENPNQEFIRVRLDVYENNALEIKEEKVYTFINSSVLRINDITIINNIEEGLSIKKTEAEYGVNLTTGELCPNSLVCLAETYDSEEYADFLKINKSWGGINKLDENIKQFGISPITDACFEAKVSGEVVKINCTNESGIISRRVETYSKSLETFLEEYLNTIQVDKRLIK
ncbi:MAG: hypothetical protein RSB45_00745 [Bacilli bacterium]